MPSWDTKNRISKDRQKIEGLIEFRIGLERIGVKFECAESGGFRVSPFLFNAGHFQGFPAANRLRGSFLGERHKRASAQK